MVLLDVVVFALTALALPWAIIELGLTAYLVNVLDTVGYYFYGLNTNGLNDRTDFLLFSSVWTILVAVVLLGFPFVLGRHGAGPSWAALLTLALNGITMIFWLAGFAAWADLGLSGEGTWGATLAFAVMLWLIFLALFVANLLAFLGVVHSERLGYTRRPAKPVMTEPAMTKTEPAMTKSEFDAV